MNSSVIKAKFWPGQDPKTVSLENYQVTENVLRLESQLTSLQKNPKQDASSTQKIPRREVSSSSSDMGEMMVCRALIRTHS